MCTCPAGYSGLLCEVTPCSSSPCTNNGICKLADASFKCECPAGYKGTRCEINPCTHNSCLNGSKPGFQIINSKQKITFFLNLDASFLNRLLSNPVFSASSTERRSNATALTVTRADSVRRLLVPMNHVRTAVSANSTGPTTHAFVRMAFPVQTAKYRLVT